MSLPGVVYRGVTTVAEPLVHPMLRWLGKESPELLAERDGRRSPRAETWWHAASVGELSVLEPLIAQAQRTGHDESLCVTTTSRTGRAAADQLWPKQVGLAPLDFPRAVHRALDACAPQRMLFVETELWPNWLRALHARRIPTAIVNARLSERSWPRYRRLRTLWQPLLQSLTAVAARTEADAIRFAQLGVPEQRLKVCGNCKHDRVGVKPHDAATLPWVTGPVWVVGSLRPGEEIVLLDAFAALRVHHPDLHLVLALRHAADWPHLEAGLERRGWRVARRSVPRELDATADVLVVDTLGELPALYAAADVAFVGGTLVPLGGHNVLEAAAAGLPVVVGPHVATVLDEVQALQDAGALRTVTDVSTLVGALEPWLGNPELQAMASTQARTAVLHLRGASARTVSWLETRGMW